MEWTFEGEIDGSCGENADYCGFFPLVMKPPEKKDGGNFVMASANMFDGNSQNVTEYLEDFVKEHEVDFMALQEVSTAEGDEIEAKLGWSCISGTTDEHLCDTDPTDGKEFAGSPKIVNMPPCKGDTRQIIFMGTSINGIAGPVVGGTHLCHENQPVNYDALKKAVEDNFDGPVIIGADTNTLPAPLAAEFALGKDQIACNEEAGKSCPGEVGARGRVDNIITYPNPDGSGEIISINLTSGVRGKVTSLTDHTPVATKVEYKIGQPQNIRHEMMDIGG